MKKVFYTLLMAVVMIGLSSCSNNMDLTGTEWEGVESIDLGEDGDEPFVLEITSTLKFTSATEGEWNISMMGENERESFTYTCDRDGNGTLTGEEIEDEAQLQTNFVVKGDKLTIVEEDGSYEFTKKK